ncbi:preprotein translocase subunit SecE [Novipirellula aureliae]|uniref:Protein translocase subunit SecE n=1 Tax=Novipirellula aureliae TaxID=2527966 RepID=A0A5C6E1T2_9BACT|nr:preprotein translocase subunit SecE [Novipirellula aureliae]TWU41336.1 preprotein translocase subunit SecE [Novipirellula aureliae]
MSRDIAGTNSAPLTSELFHASVYKPNQGRIVRQITCLGIWIIVALGCWSLYATLRSYAEISSYVPAATSLGMLAIGAWVGYRLVNWPQFADFLIAVEAEMNKVTWPSKDELIRASIVVMFTIFFLAVSLFSFDVIWQFIFDFIGVTG